MSANLTGRVALVFGAGSSGHAVSNGEAAARTYGAAGAVVVAVDRVGSEAGRVAALIVAAGGQAIGLEADVTDEAAVERAVAATVRDLGRPTILHNNVGIATGGSVVELSRQLWDATVAVNATSAFLTCKYVIPQMLAEGRGAIVNVSSIASIRDTGYVYPAYSATKAALNQLTTSIALTYAHQGIRANAILPGLIDTPLVARQIVGDDESVERVVRERDAMSPTGRMGTPWDVANAAAFLASDEAAYINGVCLPVDGGLAARSV